MTSDWKPGDRLICINNDNGAKKDLQVHQIYILDSWSYSGYIFIKSEKDGHVSGGWCPIRFIPFIDECKKELI
jgi:hypothetical protein